MKSVRSASAVSQVSVSLLFKPCIPLGKVEQTQYDRNHDQNNCCRHWKLLTIGYLHYS